MRAKSNTGGLLLLITGLLLAAPAGSAWAQKGKPAAKSKTQLERERRANLKRIKETSRILAQTQEKKQASVGQLNAIQEKLVVQQGVIKNISSELRYIEGDVQQTEGQVRQTRQRLERLKAEYARLIYAGSKTANGYNRLMFLFAAESFNQFLLRLRYIRQYTEVRQAQATQITRAQQRLDTQLTGLQQQRQQKGSLLNTQLSEKKTLTTLKVQQDQVIVKLTQQEEGLRKELADRQRAVSRLDNLIALRVREEIARAAREAARRAAAKARAAEVAANAGRSPTATSRTPATAAAEEAAATKAERTDRVTLTPETAKLAASFTDNRGRLPWPVGKGFISQRFGRHNHPVLKNVVVENRGVDIQTNSGEPVRAVFSGKVLTVASVPGMGNIVMVQHGDYFTVYAKLRNVSVSEGQTIEARQSLGTVTTNAEGTSEVQFQVWHNSANLNPENWLGRK
ncbi:murein hydrolase activator EnvC family protein [Hymenobacter psychrophilus]|uniref:Septal ring factor EnvC, activator of murein hydrolases AmiA and AmiB n=1 Tax=Hymenobacter psychrophilus TaxID=651662 RepID=A0A1H3EVZ9_9BACT|nr:peptidoglycan DD-metalloendopeptidase family protein [Hymenobacter psychrophilus]SDX82119.1 Septal ring factor EnvC, activator of murein hydrolases AmiA and AmiB [Hymenobacter psychrophilus]